MSAALRTHSDLAAVLNLPLSTTVELRKREGWPHVRLGKAVRFTDEQVAQIVASHTVTETPTAAPMFTGQRKRGGRAS